MPEAAERKPRARAWAIGMGLRLEPLDPLEAGAGAGLTPGLERALLDGVERGLEGPPPDFPPGARTYAIRDAEGLVGVLAIERARPGPEDATFTAVAIDPARRGAALGARALLLAERRLAREGVRRTFATAPRTNGRGLYFLLRCGYAPLMRAPAGGDEADEVAEACTWFERRSG